MDSMLMKTRSFLALTTCLLCFGPAFGAEGQGLDLPQSPCAKKIENIQQELDQAQRQNNARKARGLEKALSEARTNCVDDQLEKSHQKKVAEKREKVEERENELLEKVEKGDPDGIAKAQRKLGEAQQELLHAEQDAQGR